MSNSTARRPHLIVGIGASAGGLEAFKAFLSGIPDNSGLAFVLLPHLDPQRESLMVELLARQTAIPVSEAQNNQQVKANHIYILPPARALTISDGKLRVTEVEETRGAWSTIDRFLRSLAADQHERAVGIILSGTGSHGSQGLKEIKLAGGIVLAQEPGNADYDQMPASAIATGQVDLVLPAADMPAALLDYVKHPWIQQPSTDQAATTEDINPIIAVLRNRTKYDFRGYRKKMLLRRILRRMGLCHIDTIADYSRHLHEHPEEITALYKDLLIGVTSFFREAEAFHVLQQRVIPELVSRADEESPLRVWVPGCATGEEAYTLGILMLEAFDAAKKPPSVLIFATDIDEDALEVARQGVYPDSITADVSSKRLKHFFTRSGDNKFRVNKRLRDTLVFAVQNLLGDAPFSRLDIISCRNLLIYLQPDVQAKVIRLFHFALKDDGCLLLGPSESVGRDPHLFEPLSKKWRVFRRTGPVHREMLDIPISGNMYSRLTTGGQPLLKQQADKHLTDLFRLRLLAEYVPASVLINRAYEILQFYGPTIDYLDLPNGEPTSNLLAMSRDGLRTPVRNAVQRALDEHQAVIETEARVERNGRFMPCTITVRPLTGSGTAEGLAMVSFEEAGTEPDTSAARATAESPITTDVHRDRMVEQLEHELKSLRTDQRTSIEELETANEELKASNEEVMSMNEELQSANEELETSKEELQSMNEELNTVNTELQGKVEELEKSRDDVHNLLSSSNIATLFLDRDLNIELFSPLTADLLNIRTADIGRPITDFSAKIANEHLVEDARQVLDALTPIERDVCVNDDSEPGVCYLRRITPYRAGDTSIPGVVVTFIEITERHHLQEQLETRVKQRTAELTDKENRLMAIMNSVIDAIIIIDEDGLIQSVNPATEQIFGYSKKELIGHNVSMLVPSSYNQAHDNYLTRYLDTGKRTVLGQRREFSGQRKDGSILPLELTVTEIDHLGLFAGVVRDLTEKHDLEREITNASSEVQERIGREIHDNIGQQLTGLNLMAVSLKNELVAAGFKDTAKLDDMIEQLASLTGDSRTLARGLAPVMVEQNGLIDAIQRLVNKVNKVNKDNGVTCTLRYSENKIKMRDGSAATQVYRLVQEALNNAQKYANARYIDVNIDIVEGNIEITVSDDGKGFSLEKVLASDGFGLRIMNYRASVLGGRLSIETQPGQGTRVRFWMPLQNLSS